MDTGPDQPAERPPSDEDLVGAVLAGDRSAYGALYDRYVALIEAVCYDCTGDVSEAQDLCQEAFLLGFEKLDRLRRPDRYASWMIGISRRLCRDWRRGRQRAKARIDVVAALRRQEAQAPSDCAGDEEEVRRLHQAILRLPDRERLALQGFYLLDEPASRVRAILGLSQSGLYKLLDRARTRLKLWLDDSRRSPHE